MKLELRWIHKNKQEKDVTVRGPPEWTAHFLLSCKPGQFWQKEAWDLCLRRVTCISFSADAKHIAMRNDPRTNLDKIWDAICVSRCRVLVLISRKPISTKNYVGDLILVKKCVIGNLNYYLISIGRNKKTLIQVIGFLIKDNNAGRRNRLRDHAYSSSYYFSIIGIWLFLESSTKRCWSTALLARQLSIILSPAAPAIGSLRFSCTGLWSGQGRRTSADQHQAAYAGLKSGNCIDDSFLISARWRSSCGNLKRLSSCCWRRQRQIVNKLIDDTRDLPLISRTLFESWKLFASKAWSKSCPRGIRFRHHGTARRPQSRLSGNATRRHLPPGNKTINATGATSEQTIGRQICTVQLAIDKTMGEKK